MDIEVEVGGWEHACCGPVIERNQLVDLGCLRTVDGDGQVHLSETHHHLEPELRVLGRVSDIRVLREGRPAEPVLRVPSGRALEGLDGEDERHLEDPWTGEPVDGGARFLVVVETSG